MTRPAPAKHHMLDEVELQHLVERALEHYEPRLKKMMIELLDERQELIGFPNRDEQQRGENKADAKFLRALRMKWDGLATKVGNAVMLAIIAGLGTLAAAGAKALGWIKWPG